MIRWTARALAGLLLAAATVVGAATPAAAGGTWLAPVRDRYEVGDSATLVGYVGRGTLGWVDDGPFYGYLHQAGQGSGVPSAEGEPLGRMAIEETGDTGLTALRVSLEVSLVGLAPGRYEVGYCNDPCVNGLGDLIGSRPINVGVDAVEPHVREWPLDEPLIQVLQADALVSGPGYLAPAREIWAGRVVLAQATPPEPMPTTVAAVPPPTVVAAPPPAVIAPPSATQAPPASAPARGVPVVVTMLPAGPNGPVVTYIVNALSQEATTFALEERDDDDEASPGLVAFGVAMAAACTSAVLRALRR